MRVKTLKITNFKSYAGENVFEFGEGLNLIIGSNGDGKTSLYEAFTWLFDLDAEEKPNLLNNFSHKTLSKMATGDEAPMEVEMIFDHAGTKILTKRLMVKKIGSKAVDSPEKAKVSAKEEEGSERKFVGAKELLHRCFPSVIRDYSMFQGEAVLMKALEPSSNTMNSLINAQTEKLEFEDFKKVVGSLLSKAKSASRKQNKQDKENGALLENLYQKQDEIEKYLNNLRLSIEDVQNNIEIYSEKIEKYEKDKDIWETKNKLEKQRDAKIQESNSLEKEIKSWNSNVNLLDKLWILKGFEPILQDYKKKVALLVKERAEEQQKFDRDQGQMEVLSDLQTDMARFHLDEEHLLSVLQDRRCFVCGREVDEGSEAYNQIKTRLEQFKSLVSERLHQVEKGKTPFKHDYIGELSRISQEFAVLRKDELLQTIQSIEDERQKKTKQESKLADLKSDIKLFDSEIEETVGERNKTSEEIEYEENNYKTLYEERGVFRGELKNYEEDKEKKLKDAQTLERRIQDLVDKINPDGVKFKDLVNLLNTISQAFTEACNENVHNFIKKFENQTNQYLAWLSADDFQGKFKIEKLPDTESYEYVIQDATGVVVWSSKNNSDNLSQSQKVTACMAMLFATSNISKRKYKNPLIFDAPTSTFDNDKANDFYKTISRLDQQCIIMTKDLLLENGGVDERFLSQTRATVYRISKDAGFNKEELSSISTKITLIQEE